MTEIFNCNICGQEITDEDEIDELVMTGDGVEPKFYRWHRGCWFLSSLRELVPTLIETQAKVSRSIK